MSFGFSSRLRQHLYGFTLLELSVVLAIIALIAGVGVGLVSGSLKTADRISTQEKLNTIRFTLDSYGKIYGHLPCAADPKLLTTDANFGVEDRNAYNPPSQTCSSGGATGITSASNVLTGMLPVRTLGLPDSYASDAWGGKFTYAVSVGATQNPTSFSTSSGSINVKYKGASNYSVTMQRFSGSSGSYTNANSGGDANITFSSSVTANTLIYIYGGSSGYSGAYWAKTTGTTTKLTTDSAGGSVYLAYNGSDSGGRYVGSYNYRNANSGGDASITFEPSALAANTLVHLDGGPSGYKGSYWVKNSASNPTKLTTDSAGSTTYLAYNASDSGGSYTYQSAGTAAAYVVVSHGPDGRGAYPIDGAAILATKKCNDDATANSSPPPCTSSATTTCIDIENCDRDEDFFDADYNDGEVAAQYFDDYIVWGSTSLFRTAANDRIYTGSASACPTGTCEAWCAGCLKNFPATSAGAPSSTTPPTILTSGVVLCKKVLSSNSTTCTASCFWGGVGASGLYRCP